MLGGFEIYGLCCDVDWDGGLVVLCKRGGQENFFLQSKLSKKCSSVVMFTVRDDGNVSIKYNSGNIPRNISLGHPRISVPPAFSKRGAIVDQHLWLGKEQL